MGKGHKVGNGQKSITVEAKEESVIKLSLTKRSLSLSRLFNRKVTVTVPENENGESDDMQTNQVIEQVIDKGLNDSNTDNGQGAVLGIVFFVIIACLLVIYGSKSTPVVQNNIQVNPHIEVSPHFDNHPQNSNSNSQHQENTQTSSAPKEADKKEKAQQKKDNSITLWILAFVFATCFVTFCIYRVKVKITPKGNRVLFILSCSSVLLLIVCTTQICVEHAIWNAWVVAIIAIMCMCVSFGKLKPAMIVADAYGGVRNILLTKTPPEK